LKLKKLKIKKIFEFHSVIQQYKRKIKEILFSLKSDKNGAIIYFYSASLSRFVSIFLNKKITNEIMSL